MEKNLTQHGALASNDVQPEMRKRWTTPVLLRSHSVSGDTCKTYSSSVEGGGPAPTFPAYGS